MDDLADHSEVYRPLCGSMSTESGAVELGALQERGSVSLLRGLLP